MLKYLLLAVVLALAIGYVVARARAGRRPQAPAAQPTVRCTRCGVYVPQALAVRMDGRDYCCPEHGRSR